MNKYQGLEAAATLYEKPDQNHYVVTFGKPDDPACVADVFVETQTYTAKRSDVTVYREDELRGMSRTDLLKAAEIEINSMPGLPLYVIIHEAHPREEMSAIPT